jgi:hypothetical protein
MNYARDELRRGVSRPELAREMIGNAVGKLSESLLELMDNVVSDEGEPGQLAQGLQAAVHTRLSGLDAVLGVIDNYFRQQDQSEQVKARKDLDDLVRVPGTNTQVFVMDYETKIFIANNIANTNWTENYKAQRLLEKMRIYPQQEENVLAQVGGDWNRYEDIKGALLRMVPCLDGRVVLL